MRLSDHERAQGGTVRLADDQFDKLVELLTPGYELAKAYLDQQQKQAEARAAEQEPPAKPEGNI